MKELKNEDYTSYVIMSSNLQPGYSSLSVKRGQVEQCLATLKGEQEDAAHSKEMEEEWQVAQNNQSII